MTDLVQKSRPQTPDQPSLFLSLQKGLPVQNAGAAYLFLLLLMSLEENMIFNDLLRIFIQTGLNFLSTRGTINKTCILDPIKFWWVP